MRASKKVLTIILVAGIGMFAYSQYAAAYLIDVKVTESKLLKEAEDGSTYNVKLEFNNPSLLLLNAGETDFEITADNEKIADGILAPFILPAMGKVTVDGEYLKDKNSKISDEKFSNVVISGVTKYDVFFTSIDVPFVYFPTEDQAREFIHQ